MRHLLLLLLCASCADPGASRPATVPPATATAPAGPSLAPAYHLAIQLDPATAGLLGKKWSATLLLLAAADEHPGAALLALAEFGGVPGADKIAKLPGPIRDKLVGWLDEELRRPLPDGRRPAERVAGVVDSLLGLLRVIVVETDLEIAGAQGRHEIGRLGFAVGDRKVALAIPAAVAGVITRGEPALAYDAAAGTLGFGGHQFAVPLGDMALGAASELILKPAGVASLGALLEQALGCPELARALAGRCVLGQCVSKFLGADELAGMCRLGAGLIAVRLEDEIRKGRLTLLDLRAGRCRVGGGLEGSFTVAVTVDDQTATGEAPFRGEARR